LGFGKKGAAGPGAGGAWLPGRIIPIAHDGLAGWSVGGDLYRPKWLAGGAQGALTPATVGPHGGAGFNEKALVSAKNGAAGGGGRRTKKTNPQIFGVGGMRGPR